MNVMMGVNDVILADRAGWLVLRRYFHWCGQSSDHVAFHIPGANFQQILARCKIDSLTNVQAGHHLLEGLRPEIRFQRITFDYDELAC